MIGTTQGRDAGRTKASGLRWPVAQHLRMRYAKTCLALITATGLLECTAIASEGEPGVGDPPPGIEPPVGCESVCAWRVVRQTPTVIQQSVPVAPPPAGITRTVSFIAPTTGGLLQCIGVSEIHRTKPSPINCALTYGMSPMELQGQTLSVEWDDDVDLGCGPQPAVFTMSVFGSAHASVVATNCGWCPGTSATTALGNASIELVSASGAMGSVIVGHTDALVVAQAIFDTSQTTPQMVRYHKSTDVYIANPTWTTINGVSSWSGDMPFRRRLSPWCAVAPRLHCVWKAKSLSPTPFRCARSARQRLGAS